jgi:hypothetical protein
MLLVAMDHPPMMNKRESFHYLHSYYYRHLLLQPLVINGVVSVPMKRTMTMTNTIIAMNSMTCPGIVVWGLPMNMGYGLIKEIMREPSWP